ncbi:MAG: hypothetical protein JWL59_4497 [Chthoniobacteraceae bacterium]|nr:hypothetical protein [Chthoniobacteraceae bacterium]
MRILCGLCVVSVGLLTTMEYSVAASAKEEAQEYQDSREEALSRRMEDGEKYQASRQKATTTHRSRHKVSRQLPAEVEQSNGEKEATADDTGTDDSLRGRIVGIKKNDYLNVRSGPGMEFETVVGIKSGETVELRGGPKRTGKTKWIPVKIGDKEGWISDKYYEPMPAEESH